MDSKVWYTSKLFWTGLVTFLLGGYNTLAPFWGGTPLTVEETANYVLIIVGIIVVVLRFVTKTPITLTK